MSQFRLVQPGKKNLEIDHQERSQYEINRLDSHSYHLVKDRHSYEARVKEVNLNTKVVTLSINGIDYEIKVQDKLDQMIESMALNSRGKKESKDLISSMPGLVLSVEVNEGDTVGVGDTLMILEAMKMENVLKAGAAGVVHKIHCKAHDSVEKNQLLIEIS